MPAPDVVISAQLVPPLVVAKNANPVPVVGVESQPPE